MEERAHIGSMDGRVTTGRPAGTLRDELRVVHRTDDQLPGGGTLNLRVAFQAKVAVTFDQHLGVDRSVRLMAGHASLPQRVMLVDVRNRLFTMAFAAGLVDPRHGQTDPGRLHDVASVRVVTLHAIHLPFENGVSLGQSQFGMDLEVAGQAGLGIPSGIQNESCLAPACGDVAAAGSMAGFAPGLPGHFRAFNMKSGMGARCECPCEVRMAFKAGFVANEACAFDQRHLHDTALDSRTGGDDGHDAAQPDQQKSQDPSATCLHTSD